MKKSKSGEKKKDTRFVKRTVSNESAASINQNGADSRESKNSNSSTSSDAPANLFDCASLMIHCKHHDKYGLKEVSPKKNGLWFPYAVVYRCAFEAAAIGRLKHLLKATDVKTTHGYVPFKGPDIIHIFRIQIPYLRQFIQRYTFLVTLDGEACCKHVGGLVWMTLKEIKEHEDKTWGPELSAYPAVFNHVKIGAQIQEYDLRDPNRLIAKGNKLNPSQLLVHQVGVTEIDMYKWYTEFLQHCWPSQAMSVLSFHSYMSAIGFYISDDAKKEAKRYFRAFGYEKAHFLTFREFMLGLAAADKKALMKEPIGEIRVGYILRFYDVDNDGHLNNEEFDRLAADAIKTQTKSVSKSSGSSTSSLVDKEVKKSKSDLGIKAGAKMSEKDLAIAIGSLKIRGTSNLFRTNISVKNFQNFQYKVIDDGLQSLDDILGRSGNRPITNKCPKCREKKYTLASHMVTLSPTGFILMPKELEEEDVKRASKVTRRNSNEFFSENILNQFTDLMREYSDVNKILGGSGRTRAPRNYLKQIDRKVLEQNLTRLCEITEQVVKKEPRVLKVSSPCVVFGDIHGNLHDLMLYERLFWKKGAPLEAWNFLFLGDYVDRGHCSLEVAIYLFCMKCLAPQQFHILRGNHEVRSVNRAFTFYKELETKLGPQLGPRMWERFNTVFDHLACCAVIDDSIFCAHGGIPSSGSGAYHLSDLNSLACPLPNPEEQSVVAWEMLWNDPVNNQEFGQTVETTRAQTGTANTQDLYKTGFIANTKRGTAYFFSEEAVRKFLDLNGLSHVIRAHEVCAQGFEIKHRGRTITVFSSSKYGNGNNEAAVMFVDKNKIRPVKVDTTTNPT